MRYVKPEHHNDWGSDYWLAGTATYRRPGDSSWSLQGSGDEHKVINEGPLNVRWGDGTCETVDVIMRGRTVNVGDMGHNYSVVSWVPHIVTLRGEISIETANVEVEARE